MSKLASLGCSWLIIISAAYPLIDLIVSFGEVEHRVSILTIGLILIWLITALLGGFLWLFFTWMDIIREEEKKE